jgi:hypothetical protein
MYFLSFNSGLILRIPKGTMEKHNFVNIRMIKPLMSLLILLFISVEAEAKHFDLKAGEKKLQIQLSDVEFRQFCGTHPFGCARLQMFVENKKLEVGFIKVLTDKLKSSALPSYCKETFSNMGKIVPDQKDFFEKRDKGIYQCSWKSGNELTTIMWKDGITILISTTHLAFNETLIGQLKQASIL